jgi:hypothetical protein
LLAEWIFPWHYRKLSSGSETLLLTSGDYIEKCYYSVELRDKRKKFIE